MQNVASKGSSVQCGQTFEQVGQRGGGDSILEDVQNLTGRGPEQSAAVDPALSREGNDPQRSLST